MATDDNLIYYDNRVFNLDYLMLAELTKDGNVELRYIDHVASIVTGPAAAQLWDDLKHRSIQYPRVEPHEQSAEGEPPPGGKKLKTTRS
jgi:hypothetical protein